MHTSRTLSRSFAGIDLGTPADPLGRLLRPTILHDPNTPPGEGAGGASGTPAAGGGAGTHQAPPTPAPPAPPTYTPPASQAEFDRIVQDRLARDRAGRPTDEQLAEWKQKAEAHDALAAASLTAEQAATKRAEDAESAARQATERANTIARRAAILAAASKAGSVDPDAVADLLANTNAVTIDDAGQVTGADTAVQTLLTEKPYLAGGNASGSGGNGSGSSNFGGGHGRGSAANDGKSTTASGADAYAARHRKQTTTS